MQKCVEVGDTDNAETLQQKVMREAEWVILPKAAQMMCEEIIAQGETEMQKMATDMLRGNSYPGRGIIVGRSEDGKSAVCAYFIMGRSVNSRNRVFASAEDGIRTRAFDPSLVKDPSLIIYAPVRKMPGKLIVTNGDQTDTVRDALTAGGSFESALGTREYEPDAPNFTPRISALMEYGGGAFTYKLGICRKDGEKCARDYYAYPAGDAGTGHMLHTYDGDGDPLPSFTGAPRECLLRGDLESFTASLWHSLDADNKISLYTAFIDIESGNIREMITNKNV